MAILVGGSWGVGPWGATPWGGGGSSALFVRQVLPWRENVLRVEFTLPVYFSGLLDPYDASNPAHYLVTVVADTKGLDGEDTRPVTPVTITMPGEDDGISPADVGRYVDVTLDRPMTPYPAQYTLTVAGVADAALTEVIDSSSAQTSGCFKLVAPPQVDVATPARDLASPQTLAAAQEAGVINPTDQELLGVWRVDVTGDLAFEGGITPLRKRVLRRLTTIKSAFAHLPGYGVGVPSYGKKLARPALLAQLATDAQTQIGKEPDVRSVTVTANRDPAKPQLVRFRVLVVPKVGKPTAFSVPFNIGI